MTQINRTIVVTGGSRGIGRAICMAFAAEGARVFFNYTTESPAVAETEKLAAEAGGLASGHRVDVSAAAEVADFFKQILSETGRIDVLVNNAGITRDGLIMRMSEADWDRVIDVNLKGVFNCTKLAAKTMLRQRQGRIVNISSVVGASGNPGQANYAASKAGIAGLTRSVARELASRGVTVNAVAPGYVETEMTAALDESVRSAMIGQIPMGRVARAQEIADVVVFLSSEKAAYITGQVIHVSGGMYM